MKSCFFIGHRDAPAELQGALDVQVAELILEHGVGEFIVGHYGNFDRMAARAVLEGKKVKRDVCVQMLLPYHPAERKIAIPEGFDGSIYPFENRVSSGYAIVQANQRMIESCDFLVAYVRRPGKARDFLEYARRQARKRTLNIIEL